MALLLLAAIACAQNTAGPSTTIYVTKSGHKYHRANCRYLRQSKIKIKLGEAVKEGYTPCSVCNPPVLKKGS